MKIYVWDRNYAGAFIIVANSAQEAADRWNAKYPDGTCSLGSSPKKIDVTAAMFEEHDISEIVWTEGDM